MIFQILFTADGDVCCTNITHYAHQYSKIETPAFIVASFKNMQSSTIIIQQLKS
jgi:hypothetical protein